MDLQRLVHEHSSLGHQPKPPLHGLNLSKSPIKNHAILFESNQVIEPDQTKLDSTKPNIYKEIFSNGSVVAVKVLYGNSDKRIEDQFKAEVSTTLRVRHFNLVRLYGFYFEKNLRALVYEYMGNGSLDKYLFGENKILGFEKLHEIAVGTAIGIAYLHEECQQ